VDAADFESFLEGKHGAWDYFHCDLMQLREVETMVTVYLPSDPQGQESLSEIREMLARLKAADHAGEFGRLECSVSSVKDDDWGNSWKKHYKPAAIGEKLMVCPPWEDCAPGGRAVLRIEPGMAFGTGADETTRLCLEVLENIIEEGCCVLDVGCGSGILSIAALLLGAGSALGVDIDAVAVESAKRNAGLSGVQDRCGFICGNLADSVAETYDIVCANISADTILALAPEAPRLLKPGGLLILSGIIENRAKEVMDAFSGLGLAFRERRDAQGWSCIVFKFGPLSPGGLGEQRMGIYCS
jgi:ribosomal protein L11 methyltransferase